MLVFMLHVFKTIFFDFEVLSFRKDNIKTLPKQYKKMKEYKTNIM